MLTGNLEELLLSENEMALYGNGQVRWFDYTQISRP